MSREATYPVGPMLLTFLAGAAVGAVVVALSTPKSGPELRGDLKDMANRGKRKAGELADDACEAWEDLKDRTELAAGELKGQASVAVEDLKARAALAAQDLKRGAANAAKDLRA
ncbi:MAG: YtxH domain-containing protein [Holophagaceae bacterium]|nr:YtxH domain-containing protein [Holophagaceae bacterium]